MRAVHRHSSALHTPPLIDASRQEIEQRLRNFEPLLTQAIKDYLDRNTRLPVWQLPENVPGMRDHIASLRIPALEGQPSLLIYDLGASIRDQAMMGHVRNVFFCAEGSMRTYVLTFITIEGKQSIDRLIAVDFSAILQGQARRAYSSKAFGITGAFILLRALVLYLSARQT
jgi:hypothetical protein